MNINSMTSTNMASVVQHNGSDALSNLNRTTSGLNSSGLLTNITGSHNSAGNIQMDRKFLQFTTDQVCSLCLFLY